MIQTLGNGRSYTPQDNAQLFQDAGLGIAQDLGAYYIGFVKFADPASFPNVDVYAEKGSGIPSLVGAVLQDLSVGRVLDVNDASKLILADGDVNQEAITNDSIQVWQGMACHHFELVDNPGVDHFSLPGDPGVLGRLLQNIQRPRTVCP